MTAFLDGLARDQRSPKKVFSLGLISMTTTNIQVTPTTINIIKYLVVYGKQGQQRLDQRPAA